jgi:hypothetical protein
MRNPWIRHPSFPEPLYFHPCEQDDGSLYHVPWGAVTQITMNSSWPEAVALMAL